MTSRGFIDVRRGVRIRCSAHASLGQVVLLQAVRVHVSIQLSGAPADDACHLREGPPAGLVKIWPPPKACVHRAHGSRRERCSRVVRTRRGSVRALGQRSALSAVQIFWRARRNHLRARTYCFSELRLRPQARGPVPVRLRAAEFVSLRCVPPATASPCLCFRQRLTRASRARLAGSERARTPARRSGSCSARRRSLASVSGAWRARADISEGPAGGGACRGMHAPARRAGALPGLQLASRAVAA